MIIIETRTCQQLSKYHFWYINFFFFVYFYRYTFSIIFDTYSSSFIININFYFGCIWTSLKIVWCIYQNFVKYFVQSRNILYFFKDHFIWVLRLYPHFLFCFFYTSNISIGSEQNMFYWSLFLIYVFDSLLFLFHY